jgi:hypothetical protein
LSRTSRSIAAVAAAAFLLGAAHGASAERADAAQRHFVDQWMAAIKSHDTAKVKALFHPATLACIDDGNRDYFEFRFKDALRTGAKLGVEYDIERVKPLDGPPPLGVLPADGFAYPVAPTHQLQIDAETRDHHLMVLARFVAPVDGTWYAVDPCPNETGIAFFEQQRAEGEQQMAQAVKLVAAMPQALRTELTHLLARHHWLDAIDRYREATGADAATAAAVVDAMVRK